MPPRESPRETLLLILAPLLATFAGQRLYLHLVRVQHVWLAGRIIHHLYFGALLLLPAASLLAFAPYVVRWRRRALVLLGIGSAMILDELVFLNFTDGSDASYVSPRSLWGAVVPVALAVGLLTWLCERSASRAGAPPASEHRPPPSAPCAREDGEEGGLK
ncbi:MAG: hypothetical protein HYZ53_17685 [Planctomycetes bacterium]|nr:hypothetical protein [Planctomycetota bacterium]